MRSVSRVIPAILLTIITLAFIGCDKTTVLSANAGTAAVNVSAAAVRPDVTAEGTSTHSQQKTDNTRGELLYATRCTACHTAEIHWREQRLATNMDSLRFQVRRWQASIGLGWDEDEIADVVSYLNAAYYGFPYVDQKGLLEEKKSLQALRKN